MKLSIENDQVSRIIVLDNGILKLQLALDRGNIFKSLMFNGQELILIKPENYASKERPTCGCPVLFPFSGCNQDNQLKLGNAVYETGIHGIVHTNKWELIDYDETKAVFMTSANKLTKASYPFDFTLKAVISLSENSLRYELRVKNESDQVMPCDLGLHPFFLIPDLAQAEISGTFHDGSRLNESEIDQAKICANGFLCEELHELSVVISKHIKLTFKNCEGFIHMLIWSGDPKRFIVIEPLSGKVNAINDHTNKFNVLPQRECCAVLEIKAEVL